MGYRPKIVITPYTKRKRKKRYRRILILFFLVLIFFALGTYLFLSWVIKREGKDLENLRLENQRLRTEIRKFQNSDKAYEEYLRVKMGYISEGEKIILYKGQVEKP